MKLTDIVLITSTSFFTFHVKVLYFSLLVYFFSLLSRIFKNEVKDKNSWMYCDICLHISKLKILLSSLNLNSDIICISESRITKSNLQTSNVHIPGYNLNKHPQNFLQMVHWFIYLKISSYNLCEISWYSFRWTFNLVSPNLAYPDETQTRNWNTQQGKIPRKHSYTQNPKLYTILNLELIFFMPVSFGIKTTKIHKFIFKPSKTEHSNHSI